MPKNSVLKRIEVATEPPSQLKRFPCSTSSSQDHTLYPGHSSLPLSGPIAAFASKLEDQTAAVPDSPQREKFGSFLCNKEKLDLKTEVTDEHTDFLLPHERAVEDGSGFSRILSVLSDSTSTQERNRLNFFDIEDEEKFLYGDEEEVLKSESPSQSLGGSENDVTSQKASGCIPSPAPAVKQELVVETSPECVMVHELVRTIGLDSVISEVSKLASCSQEHVHDSINTHTMTY
ncbi:zinc finger protein 318-like [Sorex araneus]|uniref:zinc finger protein 318-like n=1 Tax=Sorex araneus TaxID=42254 RepID=UPI002433A45D|nr:zinc finger protein 318-like [Sorex araneus]